jgi:hypothetical protein
MSPYAPPEGGTPNLMSFQRTLETRLILASGPVLLAVKLENLCAASLVEGIRQIQISSVRIWTSDKRSVRVIAEPRKHVFQQRAANLFEAAASSME